MKKITLIITAIFLLASGALAQSHYGDLELTVLGNGIESAVGIPVKAVDEDLQTTTFGTTDDNSRAFFDDLYIYTIDNLPEQNAKIPSLEGVVQIYNLLGQRIDNERSNNGSLLWTGAGNTAGHGVYIARDEKGHSLKFLYMAKPTLLGTAFPTSLKSTLDPETRTYELHADGRGLEFNPFAEFMELHDLEADIINYVQLSPPVVSDGPSTGQVEILVDGVPAGNGSQVKMVRLGQTDTLYLTTLNGFAEFIESDGITSHPFENFTRTYFTSINAYNASNNWFHTENNNVEMALGANNNFLFTPDKVLDSERTADVTLEIILTNGNPASADAQVKTYRLGSSDTTFAYTNSSGIAEYSRLVNPFQPDAHQIAINSNACATNLFDPLTEEHSLVLGQNNKEMNPEPVAENFAEGPAVVRFNNFLTPGVEVKIWRLNNTIDTVMYLTNGAGMIYYTNLAVEGSSSQYVFESF
ncbi:MAG: hypothetical protein DRP58_12910 [Spirochaetes bacterium]|nr:MAG: hypothetical protein DRP58_12910 [Spirochaetota bacterium]